MTYEELQTVIDRAVEAHAGEIVGIGRRIALNPELGFREEQTSALVRETFDRIGVPYTYPHAVTGVRGQLGAGKYGLCILGEMDSIRSGEGNAHACGHNVQVAAMLGAAIALREVIGNLCGRVIFFAVPAEEYIDIEFRKSLKKAGKIEFFGGKQQLLREGAFEGCDAAIMLHAQPNEPDAKLYLRGHNLGFIEESITFRGKAAHGSTPYDGVNALNAAALAILGVHANRETFRDEDRIRIHPIITKGGDVVNAVPDEVCIDTYVRGATADAIRKGEAAVERAVRGAAQMVGATAAIEKTAGYLPLCESIGLSEAMESVAAGLLGRENLVFGREIVGSTDMGDLSCRMPVIQPSLGGYRGSLHSRDFGVSDEKTAYLTAAKLLAGTAAYLLAGDGGAMRRVVEGFRPRMTQDEYLGYLRGE